jgi:hypothetical protein
MVIAGHLRRGAVPTDRCASILGYMAHLSDPVGLHVALCCGCGSVRVVELSGTSPSARVVPRQRAVAPAACDTCGTTTAHAYVNNRRPDDEAATAAVRRLVERLQDMGVAVGYLSDAAPDLDAGTRAVVVELADGWRGIALRPDLAPSDVVATLRAAGAALFSEDGWVASRAGRSVAVR